MIAELLEAVDLSLGDPQPLLLLIPERNREVGAQVEELVLDPLEPWPGRFREITCERKADRGVQLVDSPVGLDPRIGLRDPAPVPEARLPPSPPRV